MDVTDLRKLLKNSDDQLNIFKDRETLSKYKLYVPELIDLINDFLSNEQKAKLFEFEHFKKLSSTLTMPRKHNPSPRIESQICCSITR